MTGLADSLLRHARQARERLDDQGTGALLRAWLLACLLAIGCSDNVVPAPGQAGSDAEEQETAEATASVTVTYLANEGFLIEAGQRAVVIDALFGDGLGGYRTVPLTIREDLETGSGRFAGIDCVLATHEHADHFSPRAVARLLGSIPAQFISTREAVEQVTELLPTGTGAEPRWLRPARHEIESVDCGGIPVSAMSFHHGRLMVKNLAYLIDFDGLTVLHVGDTEITVDEIRPWKLSDLDIDVALLPAWHLTEPLWLPVLEEIGARHVVAMHLARADAPASWFGSAGSLENRIEEIRRQVPAVWIPVEAMEERVFEAVRR